MERRLATKVSSWLVSRRASSDVHRERTVPSSPQAAAPRRDQLSPQEIPEPCRAGPRRPVADFVAFQHIGFTVAALPADGEAVAPVAAKEHPAGRRCLGHGAIALHVAVSFVSPRASLAARASRSLKLSAWAGSRIDSETNGQSKEVIHTFPR